MPGTNSTDCIACGGPTWVVRGRLPALEQVFCKSEGCAFHKTGLSTETFNVVSALLVDHRRAGYLEAIDEVASNLTRLEYAHGRSDRERDHPHEVAGGVPVGAARADGALSGDAVPVAGGGSAGAPAPEYVPRHVPPLPAERVAAADAPATLEETYRRLALWNRETLKRVWLGGFPYESRPQSGSAGTWTMFVTKGFAVPTEQANRGFRLTLACVAMLEEVHLITSGKQQP